jgi:DNA polymerase-3 subunit epsilon
MIMSWCFKILRRVLNAGQLGMGSIQSMYTNKTSIREIRWYAFDIESTGLNPAKDRILEISFVPIFHQTIAIADILTLQVIQEQMHTPAVAVHEIIQSDYHEEAVHEVQALDLILDQVQDGVLLGYFSKLDKDLLTAAFKRHKKPGFYIPIVDLAHLLKRARVEYNDENLPKSKWQLSEVCKDLGIQIEAAHTSCGDALATALIFMHIEKDLIQRGISTWGRIKDSSI